MWTVPLIRTRLALWKNVTLKRKRINYEETFLLVLKFTSSRLMLAIVAHLDLKIHQMYVKTAFLEEIYVDKLEGYVVKGQECKVC